MEQELSYLSSKLHHPNLIHYNSILVDHVNGTSIVRVGLSLVVCLQVICSSIWLGPVSASFYFILELILCYFIFHSIFNSLDFLAPQILRSAFQEMMLNRCIVTTPKQG